MKNNIHSAICKDIIEYKNKAYSIIGEIKKGQEVFVNKENKISNWLKNKIIKLVLIIFLCFLIFVSLLGLYNSLKTKKQLIGPSLIKDDMILIPAGEFIMGSTEEEALNAYQLCVEDGEQCIKEDYFSEYPQRKIYLNNFYIDKKEVSNQEYKIFIETTNRNKPFYFSDSNLNSPNQPVVGVNWEDAQTYCSWLNKRLPTEEEWEKAARGQDGRIWVWGNNWKTKELNHGRGGRPGNDESDGYLYSAPVGTNLGVSPYRVLNMAGNVSEWVMDDFKAYPGNDKFMNEDFAIGYKVLRGGSYLYGQAANRTSDRMYEQKEYKDVDLGFRCVKN